MLLVGMSMQWYSGQAKDDPAIPGLGMKPQALTAGTERDSVYKKSQQEQSKCPPRDELINNSIYIQYIIQS